MRIIQISDSHIAQETPARLEDLSSCISAVNALKPDLVIHTGDITHNALPQEYAAAHQHLEKLNAPYNVLNGNKDSRDQIFKTFAAQVYSQQCPGFLQYRIESDLLQILLIDTVRESSSKGELCSTRLQHLHTMLEADTEKRTIIFMHHSPYIVEEIPDPHQFHDWTEVESFEAMLAEYTNIEAIYCGHVHRNVEGSIGNVPVHVLSCMATDLRKGKLSDEDKTRPMYRVIDL